MKDLILPITISMILYTANILLIDHNIILSIIYPFVMSGFITSITTAFKR